ncbi:short chain oxidoreductase/dehydrogenase [Penicillium solitum]|uniref:short chain oxidoreductase/dehydrogenase n=1 Tax=Penicillium solitum TaxID=60172 RepID=UPI0032C3E074|nr:short chain oxidoreductase/dehydrogenase [Penicillium solitum]
MGTSRIDIKMPPQRPRTIPCSSRARLFVNNQALDAHFNDVHRARPTPRVVPKDRGNLAPAKSHPPSQKNPKPLQGIYLASESDRTGLTNNCDNADRLESLFTELNPFNIRVLLVEPGAFRTKLIGSHKVPAAGMTKDYEGTPLGAAMGLSMALPASNLVIPQSRSSGSWT